MKYEFISGGNIMYAGCMALVNPVNCQGVMGKGLAKEIKKEYPYNFDCYKRACIYGTCSIGHVLMIHENGKTIFNFPTKNEWRKPSQYAYIELGMIDLAKKLEANPLIKSIAIPALGCGNGGLDANIVGDMILNGLTQGLPNNHYLGVEIYL